MRLTWFMSVAVVMPFGCWAQSSGGFIFGPSAQPSLNPSAYSQVAPGQVVSFTVAGLTPLASQPMSAGNLPLPTTLAGISAQIGGVDDPVVSVPLLGIENVSCSGGSSSCVPVIQVTMEIPTEIHSTDLSTSGVTYLDTLVISDQGGHSASINLRLVWSAIQILVSCQAGCSSVVTKADGSSASVVHGGDVVVAYVYGLGKTTPLVPSGLAAPATTLAVAEFPVAVNYAFQPNAGPLRMSNYGDYQLVGYPAPLFAGAVPGYVGLYQVNIQIPPVPAGTPACNNAGTVSSNLTVTILTPTSLDGFAVCAE